MMMMVMVMACVKWKRSARQIAITEKLGKKIIGNIYRPLNMRGSVKVVSG